MEIKDARIDGGNPFDWGRTAADYARYRDIYPPEFYRAILDRGVGLAGQQVLDIGTGTGVLPRHLYKHGAHWLGVDPSPQQIAEARRLSTGMNIDYRVCAAEAVDAPDGTLAMPEPPPSNARCTVTVGFPLESSVSKARTDEIFLFVMTRFLHAHRLFQTTHDVCRCILFGKIRILWRLLTYIELLMRRQRTKRA